MNLHGTVHAARRSAGASRLLSAATALLRLGSAAARAADCGAGPLRRAAGAAPPLSPRTFATSTTPADAPRDFVIRVSNPARLHGRKGWRLVRIQAATGARILIAPVRARAGGSPGAPPNVLATKGPSLETVEMLVSMTGSTEQIREARALLDKELELESIRDQIQGHVSSGRLAAACEDFEKLRRECLRAKSPMLITDYNIALSTAAMAGHAILARRYFEYLCLSERDVQPRVGAWNLFCRAAVVGGRAQVALECLHLATQRCSIPRGAALRVLEHAILEPDKTDKEEASDRRHGKPTSRPRLFSPLLELASWRLDNGLRASHLLASLQQLTARARDLETSARLLGAMQHRNNQLPILYLLVRSAASAGHSPLALRFFAAALSAPARDAGTGRADAGKAGAEGGEGGEAGKERGRGLVEEGLLRRVILCAGAHQSPGDISQAWHLYARQHRGRPLASQTYAALARAWAVSGEREKSLAQLRAMEAAGFAPPLDTVRQVSRHLSVPHLTSASVPALPLLLQEGEVTPTTLAAVIMAVGRADLRGALDLFDRWSPSLPSTSAEHKVVYMALMEVAAGHNSLEAARVIKGRMQKMLKMEPCAQVLAIMCIAAARSNELKAARRYLDSALAMNTRPAASDAGKEANTRRKTDAEGEAAGAEEAIGRDAGRTETRAALPSALIRAAQVRLCVHVCMCECAHRTLQLSHPAALAPCSSRTLQLSHPAALAPCSSHPLCSYVRERKEMTVIPEIASVRGGDMANDGDKWGQARARQSACTSEKRVGLIYLRVVSVGKLEHDLLTHARPRRSWLDVNKVEGGAFPSHHGCGGTNLIVKLMGARASTLDWCLRFVLIRQGEGGGTSLDAG